MIVLAVSGDEQHLRVRNLIHEVETETYSLR